MSSWMDKLVQLMRLTRVELVVNAVADLWLIVLLAWYVEPAGIVQGGISGGRLPLWGVLVLTAIIASGLSSYGLALNDVMDVRRDRTMSPKRPLPAGSISLRTAFTVTVLGLLAALLASVMLGRESALLCGITAAVILFYNTTARFLPDVGIITFAVIRMLHMFIPNPELGFAWPIWVNFTCVLIAVTAAYALMGKRPRLIGRHYSVICAAWAFWTLALLGWMSWRDTLFAESQPYIWFGPLITLTIFIVYLGFTLPQNLQTPRLRKETGDQLILLASHALIVLNASWLLACGLWWQGGILLILFAVAMGLAQLLYLHEQLHEFPRRRATLYPRKM